MSQRFQRKHKNNTYHDNRTVIFAKLYFGFVFDKKHEKKYKFYEK
jgi:hypothetical protein